MATDCDNLSENAQKIFDKLQEFFPPDPWKKPQWEKCGRVRDSSTWYDLRKSADRQNRIKWEQHMIGYIIGLAADSYRKKHNGSLQGFGKQGVSKMVEKFAELLLIYEDLDYQIETGDLTD